MTLHDFLKEEKGTQLISFINQLKEYTNDGTVLINGNSIFSINEYINDGKVFINIVNKSKSE